MLEADFAALPSCYSTARRQLHDNVPQTADKPVGTMQHSQGARKWQEDITDQGELVGVVIVNYNSGSDLLQCLECLRASSTRIHSIVVVDNNSSDRSAEWCEQFSDVVVICETANGGYARAVNTGVSMLPSCNWVAVLNPDVFVRCNWLEVLKRAVRQFPEARAFASCMVDHGRPEILDGEGDVYHMSGLAWRHHHGKPLSESGAGNHPVFSACGGAALYHRQTFIELGGYDEDFFCYMEDIDFGWRLLLAGHDCIYIPEAVVEHVGSSSVGVGSDFQIYHGHRNMVWAWIKNMPAPLLIACLPYHLAANIAAVTFYCLKLRPRVVLRAKRDALAGLTRAFQKRRKIQMSRVRSRYVLWKMLDKRIWRTRFQ